MTDLQLRIIARAARIRMKNGEDLEKILASYTKLTELDKQKIRLAVKPVVQDEEAETE